MKTEIAVILKSLAGMLLGAILCQGVSMGARSARPLSQNEILALLKNYVPSPRVAEIVQEEGIDFQPTDDYLDKLRKAGATDVLINAVRVAGKGREKAARLASNAALVNQHVAGAGELTSKGDWEGAIREAREAVRSDPQSKVAREALVTALNQSISPRMSKADFDGAMTSCREALDLDPENSDAHANCAWAHIAKGQADQAISQAREALRLDPKKADAHAFLGSALIMKGDAEGGIAEAREALRFDPNSYGGHYTLAWADNVQSRFEDAATEAQEAIRLAPQVSYAYMQYAWALLGQGRLDESVAQSRKGLQRNPDDPYEHQMLGTVLEKKGDARGAFEEYRKAYLLAPTDLTIKGNYERLLPLAAH